MQLIDRSEDSRGSPSSVKKHELTDDDEDQKKGESENIEYYDYKEVARRRSSPATRQSEKDAGSSSKDCEKDHSDPVEVWNCFNDLVKAMKVHFLAEEDATNGHSERGWNGY